MKLLSRFFLLLSATLVFGGLHPTDRTTRRPRRGEPMKEGNALTRNRDRQQRSATNSQDKVLDFSADSDHEPDSNGEYTGATLEAGPLPESFTICSAFMVEAWTTEFTAADMFNLLDDDGDHWGDVNLFAASGYTEYEVRFGRVFLKRQTDTVLFPYQWTHVCVSMDSVTGKIALVVDGQLLGEKEYKRQEDNLRPSNISIVLGFDPVHMLEETGQVANSNIFNSSLSQERMIDLTTAGSKECGAPGDLVNWEEAEWTKHSHTMVLTVDREWEGPCKKVSKVQVFTAVFPWHLTNYLAP